MSSELVWFKFQIYSSYNRIKAQQEKLLVKELLFLPLLYEKTLNLAKRNKNRWVEIEKKISAAASYCMDQSFFRFLFRLARNSK